jgi:hypothetical protein
MGMGLSREQPGHSFRREAGSLPSLPIPAPGTFPMARWSFGFDQVTVLRYSGSCFAFTRFRGSGSGSCFASSLPIPDPVTWPLPRGAMRNRTRAMSSGLPVSCPRSRLRFRLLFRLLVPGLVRFRVPGSGSCFGVIPSPVRLHRFRVTGFGSGFLSGLSASVLLLCFCEP